MPVTHPSVPGNTRRAGELVELSRAYKRINAPVGELGLAILKISAAALAGDNTTYNDLENRLQHITAFGDALAARMLDRLTDAEFQSQRIRRRGRTMRWSDYVNWLAAHQGAGH